jgi:hypothetical protein
MFWIRLPKNQWAKAWRAMIEVAPVRLVADDPVYEVFPAHLDVLTSGGFAYEVVERIYHIRSPRLADPEQAKKFRKQVVPLSGEADL